MNEKIRSGATEIEPTETVQAQPVAVVIKETADAVAFVGALVSGTAKAAKDGNFSWWEAVEFRDAAALIPAAVQGIKAIPAELADLSDEEAKYLSMIFGDALDFESAVPEHLTERGVALSLEIVAYINEVRAAISPAPAQ